VQLLLASVHNWVAPMATLWSNMHVVQLFDSKLQEPKQLLPNAQNILAKSNMSQGWTQSRLA
jgi:hypothetical protein